MKLAIVAALLFAGSAPAQHIQPVAPFTDPANLRGERVSPRTGRELPIDEGARGLEQMLRKLNTRASLMLIVAHPDDEDGGMLTYYSRGLGARVADLSLTRGEGGQNAVTGDFEDALGLIRTQELLSSDRYTGVDQFFGTEVDFGFSKTKEEAFAKWTHERVLYDAVRSVRLYRPLVIAAVFLGGVTDGHGQHQVSGEIAQEVFKAAGDPGVFPELTTEGILPWQPLKVYARVPMQAITLQGLFDYATGQYAPARFTNYVTGEVTTTAPSVDVTVHEGVTDPLLSGPGEPARSYVQFARIGLGLQKTQIGPGIRLASPGTFDIGYHRYGSRLGAAQKATEATFFDGIDTSLGSIANLSSAPPARLREGLRMLTAQLAQATNAFNPKQPEALAPMLAADQNGLSAMIYALEKAQFPGKADVLHELRIKQVQLNEALTQSLGLGLDATALPAAADIPVGETPEIATRLQSRSGTPVGVFSEILENGTDTHLERLLAVDREPSLSAAQPFPQTLPTSPALTQNLTRPYFFRSNIEQPVYQLRDPALRNAPATPPALTARATLRYGNVEIILSRVVNAGEQPVSVVPAVSLRLTQYAEVLPNAAEAVPVQAEVFSTTHDPGSLSLVVPTGWRVAPLSEPLAHAKGTFAVSAPGSRGPEVLEARAVAGGKTYMEGFRPVGYPGIPRTNFYTQATDRVVPTDLHLPARKRIGYLPGTGDAVPEALASINLPVATLTVANLNPAHLAQFDTVILGVRTYNAHPDLHGAPTAALLDFARRGGNVLVQYQSPEFTVADAPYPLSLGSSEKVVDETAPVKELRPENPVFTTPNRITAADFNGWVEERGHGFLATWDLHYTALTETHDPGQLPQEGGLITSQLGRGHWTYCAFALYRQLPEAVPGSFRLMVNLLGLADAPQP